MHHVYTRRIVIALVGFFAVLALLFGPLVTRLRTTPETTAGTASVAGDPALAGAGGGTGVMLPNGQATFDNLCASCHKAEKFAEKVRKSLDSDAASLAQLEKLVGPPAHGGASPAEALAIVIQVRTLAGCLRPIRQAWRRRRHPRRPPRPCRRPRPSRRRIC